MRPGSSTETAVGHVLRCLEQRGARTWLCSGGALVLPPYADGTDAGPQAELLVANVRRADAVVIGSPGYHGSMSGVVKNAIDHLEALRTDVRPYLEGRAVGCVSTAYGWQAAVTTLTALRQVVHALRGWPTPYGMALNVRAEALSDPEGLAGRAVDAGAATMAQEILEFVGGRLAVRGTGGAPLAPSPAAAAW